MKAEIIATVNNIATAKDGQLLVSFDGHAAYFRMPQDDTLKSRILAAKENRSALRFVHDEMLRIIEIL